MSRAVNPLNKSSRSRVCLVDSKSLQKKSPATESAFDAFVDAFILSWYWTRRRFHMRPETNCRSSRCRGRAVVANRRVPG